MPDERSFFWTLSAGAVSALVPERERRALTRRFEIDPPRWSFTLGLVEMGVGTALFFVFGLAFMRPAAVDQSWILLENWRPGLRTTDFQALGLLNWVAWLLHPLSWPFAYLACVGVARALAFAITREAVAEPVVWAITRGVEALRARARSRARLRRLGPERPDRVIERSPDGSRMVVLSCRDKSDWTPAVTIAIDDRYYRIMDVSERPDGDAFALAYRLREIPASSLVRRLVRYR